MFRFDFGSKLKLEPFCNMLRWKFGDTHTSVFILYIKSFKINLVIDSISRKSGSHIVNIYENINSKNNDWKSINPTEDERINNLKIIKEVFYCKSNPSLGNLDYTSNDKAIKQICDIIILLHKINNLSAFA